MQQHHLKWILKWVKKISKHLRKPRNEWALYNKSLFIFWFVPLDLVRLLCMEFSFILWRNLNFIIFFCWNIHLTCVWNILLNWMFNHLNVLTKKKSIVSFLFHHNELSQSVCVFNEQKFVVSTGIDGPRLLSSMYEWRNFSNDGNARCEVSEWVCYWQCASVVMCFRFEKRLKCPIYLDVIVWG